ncbi:hypothetical protein [Rhodanobacter sp. L36]|uniref:hypothetical protein n=1 Tax=Rhodanobacter sp. L36 TaxID=1747221 RepID=UPI00131A9DAD|nr:hypothetical protein [Rhodanobacter sp. L36]
MSGRRDKHDADSRGRTEPTLGDIDHLDAPRAPASDGLPQVSVEPRRHHATTPPTVHESRRGWLVPLLLLLVIGIGATLWLKRDNLRNMVPQTDFNDLLGRAQQALQSGHLDGQDGTSARELYQSAIAQEPDNDRARNGLRQVGQAELAQADAALQAGRYDQAAQQAGVARELLGGGSDVDRLDQQIATTRAAQVQTTDLVDQAQQALAAGKLDGPQGAGALYRRVLQADSGNAVAAHGVDQVGDALAAQARKALDANDNAGADADIDQLAALQPNNGALPGLRATQAEHHKQQSGALDDALKQGMDALRAGHVAGDGSDTALTHFKAALAIDPDNARARDGLGMVAQALTVQADAAIDAGDAGQASGLLDQAALLAPKSAEIAAARARLSGVAKQPASQASAPAENQPDDSAPTAAPAVLSPQQSAALAQMVKRAQIAASHGAIMLPPGDSAYDLYRSVLAIDSNNEAALQGLHALPAMVMQKFNESIGGGNLIQADDMLENLSELSPGDANQATLSNRLASAWLDQAEKQLTDNDRFGAMHSLDRARKLAPANPRVQDLSARLQGAR